MSIKRLALVSDAKGVVPKGNELDTIYDSMKEREKIEESVTPNALESLRNVMQRLLSADKGVYVVKGLKDDMISYTAGSSYFITRRSMYEDTGEFIGGLIKEYCPDLANYIKGVSGCESPRRTTGFPEYKREYNMVLAGNQREWPLPS